MNFFFASLLIAILWIPGAYQGHWIFFPGPQNWITAILPWAALWNIILGVFNLLPLPPLDGYKLARPLLPLPLRRQMDSLAHMGMMSLVIVLVVGSYLLSYLLPPLVFLFKDYLVPH